MRRTPDGLRLCGYPVREIGALREAPVQDDMQPFTPAPEGELRMLVDTTLIETYLDHGRRARVQNKPVEKIGSTALSIEQSGDVRIRSLKVYPMRSIWTEKTSAQ